MPNFQQIEIFEAFKKGFILILRAFLKNNATF